MMKCTIFWDVTLCNLVEIQRRFGVIYCLRLQGQRVSQPRSWRGAALHASYLLLVSRLAYFSTTKMEEIVSSETLVGLYRTTQRYIPLYR
jgi:hypothetical protein